MELNRYLEFTDNKVYIDDLIQRTKNAYDAFWKERCVYTGVSFQNNPYYSYMWYKKLKRIAKKHNIDDLYIELNNVKSYLNTSTDIRAMTEIISIDVQILSLKYYTSTELEKTIAECKRKNFKNLCITIFILLLEMSIFYILVLLNLI